MSNRTIPSFTSIKEEAEFWDTHEITDYLDEFKIIDGVFLADKGEKKTVMTIRIAPTLKQEVEKIANSYDISVSSLVRMWIVDKVRMLQQNQNVQ